MVRVDQLAFLFASVHGQDPKEEHRQALQNILEMKGVTPDDAFAATQGWASEERYKEIEAWSEDDWSAEHHNTFMHKDGYEVKTVTYTSPEIKLKTGEAHFTLNTLTKSPFPKGDYTILDNVYRMVESQNLTREVPLSEVYMHHWLMGDTVVNPLEYCENDYYWGYGAEMRGMNYKIPDGYGLKRIGASGKCGLNMHFIRVEDLLLNWPNGETFNNPNGSWGAAVKNCAECGWAPNRATECTKGLDGSFGCCFTYSRCPVNNKKDKDHKGYKLQYDVVYTEDVSSMKALRGVVLDASGGDVEWNIAPNMPTAHKTECGDKGCVTKNTWTVDKQTGFDGSICSGDMIWSYTHMHLGAINSTLTVNGKTMCTGYPIIGTDASNPPGNEKGFNVGYTNCIDKAGLGNNFRLNKGDILGVEAWYDVDVNSTRNLPLPNGKHGGIMDLFFAMMDCDPGTFDEIYVCRQNSCVPTFTGHVDKSEAFGTIGDCQKSCGSVSV